MNDATPRKFSGSLLERAAEVYPFGLDPRPVPPPAPSPVERLIEVEPSEPEVRAKPAVAAFEPEAESEAWMEPAIDAERPSLAARLRAFVQRIGGRADDADEQTEAWPDPVVDEPLSPNGAVTRGRLARKGLLTPGAPVTILAEEFRAVKRQLLTTARAIRASDRTGARMMLVCSARPDEGKTFCAINLALSLAAERDVEILLVDADFAKPDILATLGLSGGRGLLDALADPALDVEDCIIRTDIARLSVLPAGARSSTDTELLSSARAHDLLDGLAAADPRRIVIFDSPPALAASSAAVLASHVGQVMLVVRADRTTESELRETVQQLEACEHIQLLLNAQSFNPGGRRFGAYYGDESDA